MKQKNILLLTAAPLLFLIGPAPTKENGILPTSSLPLTRTAASSCGRCHGGTPGGPRVAVVPTRHSLTPSQSIQVRVLGTGGPTGSKGGFAADVTSGALIAGSGTKTSANGSAITHTNSKNRAWTFGYRAPATPGAVELYTVVNAVDGNGKTSGDRWAFHGSDPTNTVSTPVRFFVNAPGVVPIGSGCADGYGNVGVYGASEVPRVGNTRFRLEGIGLPSNARLMFILGLQKTMPSVDLTLMGAPGCFLHSDIALQVFLKTTAGNAARAEGRFSLPAPIPNDATLKGFFFRTQIAVIDGSPRAKKLPVVFTNGLGVTIQ